MRLFTGIALPPELLTQMSRVISQLRPLAKIQWSPVENLHITLKFIGAWPDESLPDIIQALARIPTLPPPVIDVQGLGFFPHERAPRTFWAGVEASPGLGALAAAIDRELQGAGVPVESRPYRPHLTLARVKEDQRVQDLVEAVRSLEPRQFGRFIPGEFHLYKSESGRGGSVYRILASYPCRNK